MSYKNVCGAFVSTSKYNIKRGYYLPTLFYYEKKKVVGNKLGCLFDSKEDNPIIDLYDSSDVQEMYGEMYWTSHSTIYSEVRGVLNGESVVNNIAYMLGINASDVRDMIPDYMEYANTHGYSCYVD